MEDNSIIGCFVSASANGSWSNEERSIAFSKGRNFRSLLWRQSGICEKVKNVEYITYGKDLKLILLQFYINPLPEVIQEIESIEKYRKKEKSIGVSIVINDDIYFNKEDNLKESIIVSLIMKKNDELSESKEVESLDTDFHLLKKHLKSILI